jgi:hypothetical protein
MRRLALTLCALLLAPAAFAAFNVYTLTVTNVPLAGAGTNVTANGVTRSWTNVTSQTTIATNTASVNFSATNLYFAFGSYGQFGVSVRMTSTNVVEFRGIDLTLSSAGNWASITTNSAATTNQYAAMLPFDSYVYPTNRTNQATELVSGIERYSTLRAFTTWSFPNAGQWSWNQASVAVTNGLNLLSLAPSNVILRLAGASNDWNIAGISNGFPGRMIALLNGTTNTLSITNENSLSAATNRILTGGSGSPATLTTNAMALLFYDGTASRWVLLSGGSGAAAAPGGGGGLAAVGKSVWVDATFGNDSTGTRTNPALPFATLQRAKTNALAGDTIFVWPGVYNPATTLLKSNVNWHFFNGTIVTNIGADYALFDDIDEADGVGNVTVTGDAEFYSSGTYGVVAIQTDGGTVRIECKKIKTLGDTIAVYQSGGITTITAKDAIECTTSATSGVIYVDGRFTGGGEITINNSRIYNPRTNANSTAIFFDGASASNTNTTLRDCVIVCQPAVTNTILGRAGSAVRIYGSLMATPTTNYSSISILTGATRFEVGDVK